MKYEKPLIVYSMDAISGVRGSDPPTKGPIGGDSGGDQTMIPAYEADE